MKFTPPIKFRFSPEKALAAIHWMAKSKPGVDLHTVLKTCYFADKDQLNKANRPIFGATYRAMKFGPVPLEIYEMAKGEQIWLADLKMDRYPWKLNGFHIQCTANNDPDMSVFSEASFETLRAAFDLSCSLTFDARTAVTHGSDWQAAKLSYMRYEDMLDETDDKQERIDYLKEAAPYMRL